MHARARGHSLGGRNQSTRPAHHARARAQLEDANRNSFTVALNVPVFRMYGEPFLGDGNGALKRMEFRITIPRTAPAAPPQTEGKDMIAIPGIAVGSYAHVLTFTPGTLLQSGDRRLVDDPNPTVKFWKRWAPLRPLLAEMPMAPARSQAPETHTCVPPAGRRNTSPLRALRIRCVAGLQTQGRLSGTCLLCAAVQHFSAHTQRPGNHSAKKRSSGHTQTAGRDPNAATRDDAHHLPKQTRSHLVAHQKWADRGRPAHIFPHEGQPQDPVQGRGSPARLLVAHRPRRQRLHRLPAEHGRRRLAA